MGKRFFATRADLEPGIRKIESECDLKYIARGWHTKPVPEEFHSALGIPEFGQAVEISYEFGDRRIFPRDYYTGTQKYLVGEREAKINCRPISQASGGILYSADFTDDNSEAFWFQPGGMAGEKKLIGGCLVENTLDENTLKVFKKFTQVVLKGFVKVKDVYNSTWYVGPEALQLLKNGVRLTTNYPNPLPIPEETVTKSELSLD